MRRASFQTPLRYEPLNTFRCGRPEYRLTEEFSFELGGFGSCYFITVPAGYITDFASIPPGARWLFPPNGPWAKAAVIHDYMYEYAAENFWRREFCDLVFLNGMRLLKCPKLKSLTMYYTVRLFGARNFGKKTFEICQS
tara:strand:+ start:213 stop:629 length:417 start_codon:yes stop_codon:yes gene_type:complete